MKSRLLSTIKYLPLLRPVLNKFIFVACDWDCHLKCSKFSPKCGLVTHLNTNLTRRKKMNFILMPLTSGGSFLRELNRIF